MAALLFFRAEKRWKKSTISCSATLASVRVLELGLEEDAAAGLAGVVVQGVLPITAVHPDQIHLALGALAGEGLGIDASAEALEPREVVVEEQAVQIRHVHPQPAALSARRNVVSSPSSSAISTLQLGQSMKTRLLRAGGAVLR